MDFVILFLLLIILFSYFGVPDFAGNRLWKFRHEFHDARVFVRRGKSFHVLLDSLFQFFRRGITFRKDNRCFDNLSAHGIGCARYRAGACLRSVRPLPQGTGKPEVVPRSFALCSQEQRAFLTERSVLCVRKPVPPAAARCRASAIWSCKRENSVCCSAIGTRSYPVRWTWMLNAVSAAKNSNFTCSATPKHRKQAASSKLPVPIAAICTTWTMPSVPTAADD